MYCKFLFGIAAAVLLTTSTAFAGGVMTPGYSVVIPVPLQLPNAHADYGILDDTPIIQGGPIISDGIPDTPPNATAYIFVTPRGHGSAAADLYIVPDGLRRHGQSPYSSSWRFIPGLP